VDFDLKNTNSSKEKLQNEGKIIGPSNSFTG
jgi:hypothetical protein